MTIFLLLIYPNTCAMAWSSVHTNAILLIGDFLELEMRLGRYCFLPSLFVSYFLKLDGRFYRLREEVNLHPTEAYADFGSIFSNFAVAVLLSFKISIRVSMDPAMKGSGARKRKKSLSPSNAVSRDCRDVLKDITNLSVAKTEVKPGKETNVPDKPGRRVKKSSNSPASACDVECREIKSPPVFMFDLGINCEINQCSPLFQELSQVKVEDVDVAVENKVLSHVYESNSQLIKTSASRQLQFPQCDGP